MTNENFCAESLEARRKDVAFARDVLNRRINDAVQSAEDADLEQMYELLYKAQKTIDTMRSDLEDLVLERERQMETEGEQ